MNNKMPFWDTMATTVIGHIGAINTNKIWGENKFENILVIDLR